MTNHLISLAAEYAEDPSKHRRLVLEVEMLYGRVKPILEENEETT